MRADRVSADRELALRLPDVSTRDGNAVLNIHFTAQDLLRTRIVTTYGPLSEALLSLITLKYPPTVRSRRWRQKVLSNRPSWTMALGELVGHYAPVDLITLVGPVSNMSHALATLEGVPAEPLRQDIFRVYQLPESPARRRSLPPPWVGRLADDRDIRRQAIGFFRDAYATAIAPYWTNIHLSLRREESTRSSLMATGGIDALMQTLHSCLSWSHPVLRMPSPGPERHMSLAGRGLELVPSAFAEIPALYISPLDEAAPYVLVYPMVRDIADVARIFANPEGEDVDGVRALEELLGRTRAAVLIAADHERTTGQLARRVGITLSGASQHASVLRAAGLLESRRDGPAMLHRLTPLGHTFLNKR